MIISAVWAQLMTDEADGVGPAIARMFKIVMGLERAPSRRWPVCTQPAASTSAVMRLM